MNHEPQAWYSIIVQSSPREHSGAVMSPCRPKCTAAEWNRGCTGSSPRPSEGLATAAFALLRVLTHHVRHLATLLERGRGRRVGRVGGREKSGIQPQLCQHSNRVLQPLSLQTGKWTSFLEHSSLTCHVTAITWVLPAIPEALPNQAPVDPQNSKQVRLLFKPVSLGIVYSVAKNNQTIW